MRLQNSKTFPILMIKPELIKNIITLLTNCDLIKREAVIFNESMKLLATQIEKENIDLYNFHVFNIFFTLDGTLSLYEDSKINRGIQFHVAIYRMEQIRELKSEYAMMFIFLEEMVHFFWRSADELFVKNKVVEIMKILIPDFNMEYMTDRWKLNGI